MKTIAEIRAALVALLDQIDNANNLSFGKVCKTTDGRSWVYVDRDPGDEQYANTLRDALLGLIDRAWARVQ